jgi:signal peptidase I
MARNLISGDFIIINKVEFGARLPITPLAIPFLPARKNQASPKYYLDWISLPYIRIPGYSKINHNDIIAFNNPEEEDIPIDKRIKLVKRCIALPGDTFSISKDEIFVNHKKIEIKNIQFEYFVKVKGRNLSKHLIDKYQINEGVEINNFGEYDLFLMPSQADSMANEKEIANVVRETNSLYFSKNDVFPHDPRLGWTSSNYGPIIIPKAKTKLIMNTKNIIMYKYIIEKYEGCTVTISSDSIFINNTLAKNYYFKNNYYFMLDDNRDNANDSRFWGFLPESHIIGKAAFILVSLNPSISGFKKIRWNRSLIRVK